MFFQSKFKKYFHFILAAFFFGFSFNLTVEAKTFKSAAAPATVLTQTQTGSVTREIWFGVGGTDIYSLPFSSLPSYTDNLTNLETPSNWADNYGTRIRGFITAPQTGSYTFWIAGDDDSELWLSGSNQSADKTRIAFVGGWTYPREWAKYATQKSRAISLNAGQSYYFEVRHKDGTGGDNLAVGWSKPGQSNSAPSEIVPGSVLSALSSLTSEQARAADSFVESIGVNVHLGYTGGVYDNFAGVVKPRLAELGVRYIRDGLEPKRLDTDAKLKDLYASLGIKSLLIMNPNRHTATEARDYVKNTLGAEKVSAIEGINEPNIFIGGSSWADTTKNFQQQMFQAFRSDAATANLPFVAPSLVVLDPDATVARAFGDLSAYADFGSIHNYYGGRNPETSGWGGNGYGGLSFNLNFVAAPVSGTKQVWSTETGYHNAFASTSGHKYTPESVEARYLPRLFLHQFNRGVAKSFSYELFDQGTNSADEEQNFGLLHFDNSPKPAFNALKNLIALLKDAGANFAPGELDYSLSGETSNVQHTLLQKRDGTFYLVLWVGAQRWNADGGYETDVPNQTVFLNLNSSISAANVYLPTSGANVVASYANPVQLTVSVPDAPLVIELKPGASTPVSAIANGVYRLTAECSGKSLDVYGVNLWDGGNAVQWTANSGANQQWRIAKQSGGDYTLTATHSGKLLDVYAAGTQDGANVIQWSANGGANQRWQIVPVGGGFYKLVPQHAPGKALDVAGASSGEGANVQIWTDNGGSGQRWKLEYLKP